MLNRFQGILKQSPLLTVVLVVILGGDYILLSGQALDYFTGFIYPFILAPTIFGYIEIARNSKIGRDDLRTVLVAVLFSIAFAISIRSLTGIAGLQPLLSDHRPLLQVAHLAVFVLPMLAVFAVEKQLIRQFESLRRQTFVFAYTVLRIIFILSPLLFNSYAVLRESYLVTLVLGALTFWLVTATLRPIFGLLFINTPQKDTPDGK